MRMPQMDFLELLHLFLKYAILVLSVQKSASQWLGPVARWS